MCFNYPVSKSSLLCTQLCPTHDLSGCALFLVIIQQTARFSGEKKCNRLSVYCYFLYDFRFIFFYFGKNSTRLYHRSIWVFTQKPVLTKLALSRQILIKVPHPKFHRIPCIGRRVIPCVMTASNHHKADMCCSSSRRYYVTHVT